MYDYIRANYFLRATEVRPFTTEHRRILIKYIKANLDQLDIHKKAHPKSYEERVRIVENMFKMFMEYPEFLSTYYKFRIVAINKIYEISSEMKNLNLPESQILNDAKYFMRMISARPDFINYDSPIQTPSVPEHTTKLSHSYNLRSRNKRMRCD